MKKKRKKPTNMNAKTLDLCRALAPYVLAAKCDRRTGFSKGKSFGNQIDLFGIADQVAVCDASTGTVYIQSTSLKNTADRCNKIIGELGDTARKLLRSGNRIQVWGWRKVSERRFIRKWWPRRLEIVYEDGSFGRIEWPDYDFDDIVGNNNTFRLFDHRGRRRGRTKATGGKDR